MLSSTVLPFSTAAFRKRDPGTLQGCSFGDPLQLDHAGDIRHIDVCVYSVLSVSDLYPPTPADARGSAPGSKTSKFSRASSKSSGSGSSSSM